jgi:hypothetical protein
MAKRYRRVGAAVVATVVATGMAACGGGGDSGQAHGKLGGKWPPLARAVFSLVAKTMRAKSGQLEYEGAERGGGPVVLRIGLRSPHQWRHGQGVGSNS